MVAKDVIPFGMVYGERAKLMGLNLVELEGQVQIINK